MNKIVKLFSAMIVSGLVVVAVPAFSALIPQGYGDVRGDFVTATDMQDGKTAVVIKVGTEQKIFMISTDNRNLLTTIKDCSASDRSLKIIYNEATLEISGADCSARRDK